MDTTMVQISMPTIGSHAVPVAVLPRAGGAETATPPKQVADNAPQAKTPDQSQVMFDSQRAEHARHENIQRAAQAMFKDVYAVRDSTFSIYKDNSGQYITRFTSLRDGKVTYYPEPEMLQYMKSQGGSAKPLVSVNI